MLLDDGERARNCLRVHSSLKLSQGFRLPASGKHKHNLRHLRHRRRLSPQLPLAVPERLRRRRLPHIYDSGISTTDSITNWDRDRPGLG